MRYLAVNYNYSIRLYTGMLKNYDCITFLAKIIKKLI